MIPCSSVKIILISYGIVVARVPYFVLQPVLGSTASNLFDITFIHLRQCSYRKLPMNGALLVCDPFFAQRNLMTTTIRALSYCHVNVSMPFCVCLIGFIENGARLGQFIIYQLTIESHHDDD